jgi:hypothetical protein
LRQFVKDLRTFCFDSFASPIMMNDVRREGHSLQTFGLAVAEERFSQANHRGARGTTPQPQYSRFALPTHRTDIAYNYRLGGVMKARFAVSLALVAFTTVTAHGQTTIINETFDSYADQESYRAVWVPTNSSGTALQEDPAEIDRSRIIDNDTIPPGTNITDIQGRAAAHLGAIASPATPGPPFGMNNQWGGPVNQVTGNTPDFNILPSATENVFLKFDLFDSGQSSERMSVGLRHINVVGTTITTTNILEMGMWNANPTTLGIAGTVQPVPSPQSTPGYAFRIINFGPVSPPLTAQPNWQYWELPAPLDGPDTDTIVKFNDIGPGWHTYSALITPTEITVSIDLFRDGVQNNTRDENGPVVGVGTPGLADASLTLPVATNAVGFNALRIGGPSGVSSAGAGLNAFDNILLQMVPANVPAVDNADFDGDGDVDGADFLTWQRGLGEPGDRADGNANPTVDGDVDADDLAVWKAQFGTGSTPATPAASAIPEPAALALACFGVIAGMAVRRRR